MMESLFNTPLTNIALRLSDEKGTFSDDECIVVHKEILRKAIPYFDGYFSDSPWERSESEIVIKGAKMPCYPIETRNKEVFAMAIESIYSDKPTLVRKDQYEAAVIIKSTLEMRQWRIITDKRGQLSIKKNFSLVRLLWAGDVITTLIPVYPEIAQIITIQKFCSKCPMTKEKARCDNCDDLIYKSRVYGGEIPEGSPVHKFIEDQMGFSIEKPLDVFHLKKQTDTDKYCFVMQSDEVIKQKKRASSINSNNNNNNNNNNDKEREKKKKNKAIAHHFKIDYRQLKWVSLSECIESFVEDVLESNIQEYCSE